MLIFNTTYKVTTDFTEKWLNWIRNDHVPFMLKPGVFSNPQIAKVVGSEDEEGVSYSVQFHIADMNTLIAWHNDYALIFQNSCAKEFGTSVNFFSTVLEVVS